VPYWLKKTHPGCDSDAQLPLIGTIDDVRA
jgi:hypothetical protein